MLLEHVSWSIFEVIFQKNVLLYLLVLKCVKIGEKCFVGEGLTPATSDVKKVIHLGFKIKVLAKNKNI